MLGEHEDGKQSLFEVPRWKVGKQHGPDGIADLEALQAGLNKMLEPKSVIGKTTLIKRKAK